jgi:signal transduction histidine kinase/ActR/RegA family two-component response regulator/predicted RNA-binding protein with RPS1 domain
MLRVAMTTPKYHLGQRVEGIVESVFRFGVFVRLGDETKAFIRRRELELDSDVDPLEILQAGEKIDGIVTDLGNPQKCLEISHRKTLPDHWGEFLRLYREGSVVTGTVQSLTPHGIYLRLLSGIDGFVPLDELATWKISRPDEIFWENDSAEAIITRIVPNKKKIRLSIKARLEQRAKALGMYDHLNRRASVDAGPEAPMNSEPRDANEKFDFSGCRNLGPILIVDDHQEVRLPLAAWLDQRGFEVAQASSLAEGLAQIGQKNWGLLLIDLNLYEHDGLQLVRYAREKKCPASICVMSSSDFLNTRTEELEKAELSHVFAKPLDMSEIEVFLTRLCRGETIPSWRAVSKAAKTIFPAFPDISEFDPKGGTPYQRLQTSLSRITEFAHAEVGLIFEIDPSSDKVSILAQAGDDLLSADAMYGLGESPVEDVIRGNEAVFENCVSENAPARFKKLLDLLGFESCIGVPIEVHEEIHHAAFIFHREPDAFSKYRLRDLRASALHFGALLAEDRINRRLRSLHPILLGGELAAGFGHEVANKISGLELQLRLFPENGNPEDYQNALKQILDLTLDLKETVGAFQQLSRTTEDNSAVEFCDVNAILHRADLLLRPIARKEGVKITMKLAPDLPPIAGSAITLQQVFLNLMLNAVQQMARKPGDHRVLAISTHLVKKAFPIEVRFWDTGPGIHRTLWEKIFAPGFSTRGGNGLGLFIARNFLRSLGGRIRVEESFVPLGATFLIELPGEVKGDQR